MKFEIENKSLRDSNISFRIEFEVDDTMYNQAVNATSKIADKTITTNDVKDWINQALSENIQIQVFESKNKDPVGLFIISPKYFREEIKARILFTKGELARTIISEIEIAVAKRISGDAKKVEVKEEPPKEEPPKEESLKEIPDTFSREIELEGGTFSLKINCLLEIDKNKWANHYNESRALFEENPLNLLQKIIHNSTYNFHYKGIGTEINLKRVFYDVFVNQICSSVDVLPVPSEAIKDALNDMYESILDEIEGFLPEKEEVIKFQPFEMTIGALRFTFHNVNLNAKVLKNKENKTILQLLDEGLLKYAEVNMNMQDFWRCKYSNHLVLKNIDGPTFAKTFRNILSYYELDTQEFINKFGEVFGVKAEKPQNKVKFLLEKMAENRHKPLFFQFYNELKKELNLNEG